MEIIIEHGRTKRKLTGALNICGSPQDLRHLAESILRELNREGRGYGWISIPSEPLQFPIANTVPLSWEEEGERDDA